VKNEWRNESERIVFAFFHKRVDFVAETNEKTAEWQSGRNGKKILSTAGSGQ
jgi:hypothetical protein